MSLPESLRGRHLHHTYIAVNSSRQRWITAVVCSRKHAMSEQLTVADYVVRRLAREGIADCFGVAGAFGFSGGCG
jgi:hypothetical protein